MALPIPPNNPNNPIPNNPFYSDETTFLRGPYYPAQVTPTSGLTVDPNGALAVTGGGGGGGGIVSISGTAPIVVTSGSAAVVSIASASTTQSGAVQLFDGTNSTSTALALTANQGKLLQDQINSLLLTPGIELAGTLDASTGLVASVTSIGTGAGYTTAAVLPAASVTTNNTYVIVTTPGTVTPPGGVATVATQGDWFLVSETSPGVYAWQFLNVGFDAPAATTTVAGIVCLSTNALAQAGTNTTTALTPAAASFAFIPKSCISRKGSLITGTAASTPFALNPGNDGEVLIACSTAGLGLCWGPVPAATPARLGTVCGCTCLGTAALGSGALASQNYSGTAYNNVALGCRAGTSITTGFKNIAVGSFALECGTTMSDNVGIGVEALRRNTSGTGNIGIGTNALVFNTTGVSNVAIGFQAAQSNTGGSGNVVVGTSAANGVGSLSRSVLVGEFTMVNSTGTSACNVGVGWSALENVTGNNNTAIGTAAGAFLTTGGNNVAIGYCAQVPFGNQFNQLAIGYNAGCNWLTGDGDKHIRPGAGIRDCAGALGTAGQVLTSTGAAIQWASAAGAKQYAYALVGSNSTVNANITIPIAALVQSSGISVFAQNFLPTAGRTYLLNVNLTTPTRSANAIVRWVNNIGQVGPEIIFPGNGQFNTSSSWIYKPVAGSEGIRLELVVGSAWINSNASSVVITEL
jgi:hypothetical protein